MKLLVLSDSHGNVDNMVEAVNAAHPDLIIHLGDVMHDAEKLHAIFPEIPMEQVPGNCDYAAFDAPQRVLCLNEQRVMICHGHTLHVKSGLLTAMYAALEQNADLLLFGHTHKAFLEERNGVWLFNPGSIGDYRSPTYGVIVLEGKQILPTIVSLRDNTSPS